MNTTAQEKTVPMSAQIPAFPSVPPQEESGFQQLMSGILWLVRNAVFIGLVCALLGAGAVILADRYNQDQAAQKAARAHVQAIRTDLAGKPLLQQDVCDIMKLEPCPANLFKPTFRGGSTLRTPYEWEFVGLKGCVPFTLPEGFAAENADGPHKAGDLLGCESRFRIWNEVARSQAEGAKKP